MPVARQLLFGGSFDPIHVGHLIVGRAVAEGVGCGGVVLVPAAQSPHKAGVAPRASGSQRLEMLYAAVAGNAFFDVLPVELERAAPSYSYDTVEILFGRGWRDLRWLIGADQVGRLPEWHRAAELVQRVEFVVAARPGYSLDFDSLPEAFRKLRHNVVVTPNIEISSTEIRERVHSGRSITYLVPPAVESYILQHGLYK